MGFDPEPDKVRSTLSRRDNMWNDDWVGMSLDSVGNSQSSYDLFVNPQTVPHLLDADTVEERLIVPVVAELQPLALIRVRDNDAVIRQRGDVLGALVVVLLNREQ